MNNPRLYNAAYSGALSGMLTNRVRLSSYTAIVAGCVAFATAVDNAIPVISGDASAGQQELLSQLCRSAVTNIYATTVPTSVITQVVAAYNASASALAAESSGGLSLYHAKCVIATGVGTPASMPIVPYDGVTPNTGDLVILANAPTDATFENMGPWIVGPIVGGNATLARPSWFVGNIQAGNQLTVVDTGYFYAGTIWNSFLNSPAFDPTLDWFLFMPYSTVGRVQLVAGVATAKIQIQDQAVCMLTRLGAAAYSGGSTHTAEYDVEFTGSGGSTYGYQIDATIRARAADDTVNTTDVSVVMWNVVNSNSLIIP